MVTQNRSLFLGSGVTDKQEQHAFKTKSTVSTATFFRTFLKLKIIRLLQGHAGVVHQVTETAIFIATHYEKTYLAVHFAKGYFLTIFQ